VLNTLPNNEYKGIRLDTKTITTIISFSALAIVLNPVRIPTIFWPGQYFRLWEIPIIVAFLLFGFKIGFSVAVLNAVGQLAFFMGPTGALEAPWGLILMLTMFLGIYFAKKMSARSVSEGKPFGRIKPVTYFTVIVTVTRVAIMPLVDYSIYRYVLPLFVGRTFSNAYVLGLMPFIVLFNLLVPLYIVPISYLLAKTLHKNLRVGKMVP
jgi:riboflavin transporter FmnP